VRPAPALDPVLGTLLERLGAMERTDAAGPMLPRECYTLEAFFDYERDAVFAHCWHCVGRAEQIPQPGDYLAARVADEPLLIVRGTDGEIRALSAVCQHRGEIIACESGHARSLRCPLHFWTYDLEGRLIAAPRMGQQADLEHLKKVTRLPVVRCELWHGFIFVTLDDRAAPVAAGLSKVEPFWENYEAADLVGVPPVPSDQILPWNWKLHFENFTDAYHPEFVHRGTHDFAPSNHPGGGVSFFPMESGDEAIIRTVPLLKADGGMTSDGWGDPAAFPPIATLGGAQRERLAFVMIPPGMTIIFAPNAIAYQLITPLSALSTTAANDRISGGGWLLPRTTLALPDFAERAASVRTGGSKIWAQDLPVNLGMQAGKRSRFAPGGVYGPLETTLVQFNAWLLRKYLQAPADSPAPKAARAACASV